MDVLLRDVRESDFAIFFEHQLDPVALQMVAFTPRDKNAFREHWTKILADPTVAKQAILFGGHVVGNCVAFERSGKREVGYWIGREYWGKGIATQALFQFLRHATERPLYAVVAKHNLGSLRVLEKCGFVIEGKIEGPLDAGESVVEELLLKLDANA